MTPTFRRAFFRTAVVLLAIGTVVAGTYALTPRFDPIQEETAEAAQAKMHPPSPGSEAALRQAISEVQSGVPDYDRARKARVQEIANFSLLQRVAVTLAGGVPVRTNKDILDTARQQQQTLEKLGVMQSVAYLGGESRFDRYRVTFRNGPLLWFISLGKNGALLDYGFGSVGIPTPQNYIDDYAQFSMRERSIRMAEQLGILLAVALFGRWALRVRL